MVEAGGGRVSRLMRVRFGPVLLPLDLPAGRSLELASKAIEEIVRTAKSC
jgi:16S rRNA U516 pseudouridylate synthase RsuA-like enzyme